MTDYGAPAAPLCFDDVCPGRERLIEVLNIDPGRPVGQRWLAGIDELLAVAPRLIRARAVYRVDPIAELGPRQLTLASGTVIEGTLRVALTGAEAVASFLVTVGSGLERLARRWMRDGQVLRGTVIDAIASEAVEVAADRVVQRIRMAAAPRGEAVTVCLSPGYCGMEMSQQQPLLDSLPARQLGVRLMPSFLMMPVKSLSGLIGIGPKDRVRSDLVPCALCNHPHCQHRRAPFDPAAVR